MAPDQKSDELRIIFLGTAQFAIPFLQALIKHGYKPVLVITKPDEASGRNQQLTAPPLKVAAQQLRLPIAQPKTYAELHALIEKHQPDVCVLVAYGRIIKSQTLTLPRFGFINAHPSLLPAYRGPSPVQTAILNGEQKTGITLIQLDEQIDHGPIIAQESAPIQPTDTNSTLHEQLAQRGGALLVTILSPYTRGLVPTKPQDETKVSMTNIYQRADGAIDWQQPAAAIDRQYRALQPWPGVFTIWAGKRVKLNDLTAQASNDAIRPGLVAAVGDKVIVGTAAGVIVVGRLQLEGKTEMAAFEFIKGNQSFVGSQLG
ncbi:MAG: methionyl-tRNA formyltransferase [Candidatus Buchananbacteria bacterium RIFCSPHIGHO2_01_FULL_47_11b]|uniref:Methionyl-tRNA formyltransferase n=1 Tax=Candidatus Buchananbacteria bacterium RIFCSPHIGHO2_01_FULL_47_11b TaxID=1797537 RepID=A0A1G1Y756_9BACT|nr:MAG: methionyl-tRNA formyltransferase [Candidatus Buchananbacteria bacterium RIFCSPHIGHO2_01_FULL_47_11b]